MVDYNLRTKKYLASYVITTMNEDVINKLQKCLKTIIVFCTILRQLTMICCFSYLGENFLKFNPFVFLCGV